MSILLSLLPWTGIIAVVAAVYFAAKAAHLEEQFGKANVDLKLAKDMLETYRRDYDAAAASLEAAKAHQQAVELELADIKQKIAAGQADAAMLALAIERGEAGEIEAVIDKISEQWNA